jgi:hypothetical protein
MRILTLFLIKVMRLCDHWWPNYPRVKWASTAPEFDFDPDPAFDIYTDPDVEKILEPLLRPELTSPDFMSTPESNPTQLPEFTLNLCQSQLYPPVRDFVFGLGRHVARTNTRITLTMTKSMQFYSGWLLPQNTYFTVRGQSYFSGLPKYWPPHPTLRPKTREIGLPSYSKICTLWLLL